eukprot:TRINITY_DN8083_c0_g1_i1.p1 TRINITY_DN8083_c0_g1~~TRINITY_DN8083_c0_g1_i1.p1  ORF type:complete len:367 (-),score=44.01 TRINITY_DN8083_c0_g1_i1:174-1274(-)
MERGLYTTTQDTMRILFKNLKGEAMRIYLLSSELNGSLDNNNLQSRSRNNDANNHTIKKKTKRTDTDQYLEKEIFNSAKAACACVDKLETILFPPESPQKSQSAEAKQTGKVTQPPHKKQKIHQTNSSSDPDRRKNIILDTSSIGQRMIPKAMTHSVPILGTEAISKDPEPRRANSMLARVDAPSEAAKNAPYYSLTQRRTRNTFLGNPDQILGFNPQYSNLILPRFFSGTPNSPHGNRQTNESLSPGNSQTDSQNPVYMTFRATKMKNKRKKKRDSNLHCSHCKTEDTPEWRRGPLGKNTLCNACGLQYAKRKKMAEQRGDGRATQLSFILNMKSNGSGSEPPQNPTKSPQSSPKLQRICRTKNG